MGYRRFAAVGIIAIATACGDGSSPTSTPVATPPPPPAGASLAVFTDASGVQTTDVLDANNELMRFDTIEDTLIWTPLNLLFDGWVVNGNFLDEGRLYQVRFGSVNGERRAYFTETGRGTICDLSVVNNFLQIQPTDLLPPQ